MAIEFVTSSPWTRKHDDPRFNLIPKAAKIAFPKSLSELIELCRKRLRYSASRPLEVIGRSRTRQSATIRLSKHMTRATSAKRWARPCTR